jgi:hypothetical protein
MSYTITGNYKQQLNEVREKIDALSDNANVLRTAGLTAVAIILNRNQQKGAGSDGRARRSRAKKTTGAYSAGHAKRRRQQGRQIATVDLNFSGDTQRSFDIISANANSVEIGFLNDRAAQIAEYNEAYYGTTYELSAAEEKAVVDGAIEEILNKIK